VEGYIQGCQLFRLPSLYTLPTVNDWFERLHPSNTLSGSFRFRVITYVIPYSTDDSKVLNGQHVVSCTLPLHWECSMPYSRFYPDGLLPRRTIITNSSTSNPTRHFSKLITILRDVRLYYVGTNSVWSTLPAIKYHVKVDTRLQLMVQNKSIFSFITSASLVSFSTQERCITRYPHLPTGGMDVRVLWMLCCAVRGLRDGPIPQPGESYRACACQWVWSGATITLNTYYE
jgi:hypothetical protein